MPFSYRTFAARIIFILSLLLPSAAVADENATANDALFPVTLGHEFPDPGGTFEEVKNLILEQYYSDEITEDTLYWAAIEGMLRRISPPENRELAKIWTPAEYEKIFNDLNGTQISIGIKSSFNEHDGSLTVTDVLPGSPAETVLQPYDRILRIDSELLKGKSLKELNALLEGAEDTDVVLTINRGPEIFEVRLRRRQFTSQNFVVSRLTDSIALLEIRKITAEMTTAIKNELTLMAAGGIKGLVLDLRDNTGGVFIEALRLVELFLPENKILLRTVQRDTRQQNYVSTNPAPFEFSMAIIVNDKTASAAEIIATSLQDHQKAIIIGTRTYGKGVFEKTFLLENEFRVKFITGAMYSPRGRAWQGKGLLPDFLVDQEDAALESMRKLTPVERLQKDIALITAVKLLRFTSTASQ